MYPNTIYSQANPTENTFIDDTGFFLDIIIGLLNDNVTAIENKLGVNSSAINTSIDYLLKNPLSINPGHKHTTASITFGADENFVTAAQLSNLHAPHSDDQTIPVKATGDETNTGTDNDKFVTPKALADSDYAKTNDIPTAISKATSLENVTGTDDAKYLTALSNVPAFNSSMARQAIINGNFDVWQRGVSFTNAANTLYCADRWRVLRSDDAQVDVKQTADRPTVVESGTYSNYCLHCDVTTADSTIAVGQFYGIMQKLEGDRAAAFGFGQTGTHYITLSFWVKSTKTGTFCVSFRNSATDRSYIAEYTVSSTNTWEKKTITIPVDTTGTWVYDSGTGIQISFMLACGSTFQTAAGSWTAGNYLASSNQVNALDSNSNDFKLAQVQLCAGDVALPFMPKSFEEELRACERYYEILPFYCFSGTCFGTTSILVLAKLQPKRTNTWTETLVTNAGNQWHDGNAALGGTVTITNTSKALNCIYLQINGTTGGATGRSVIGFSSTTFVTISNEL